jgi:hypothetical protein
MVEEFRLRRIKAMRQEATTTNMVLVEGVANA